MRTYRKTIQYVILAIVLLVGGYAISTTLTSSSEVIKAGDKPADFKLLGLDGQVHSLADYEGKPLIINFWGTFCPPCRAEMPALQAQYEKWKNQGLELIGINLSEDRLSVESFLREVGVDFPILLDKDKKIERAFGLKQYPTTFFVGRDGTIRDMVIGGPLSESTIEEQVNRILESK